MSLKGVICKSSVFKGSTEVFFYRNPCRILKVGGGNKTLKLKTLRNPLKFLSHKVAWARSGSFSVCPYFQSNQEGWMFLTRGNNVCVYSSSGMNSKCHLEFPGQSKSSHDGGRTFTFWCRNNTTPGSRPVNKVSVTINQARTHSQNKNTTKDAIFCREVSIQSSEDCYIPFELLYEYVCQ